jgi:hypothetical protein
VPRVTGAAHDDRVESSLQLVHDVLDAAADYSRMLQPKLPHCTREERDALSA